MTFLLVKRTNDWDRRGNAINETRTVIETFDTLGIAIAHKLRLNEEWKHTWGYKPSIAFDVEDLYGKRYGNGDQWPEMVDEDTLERLFELKKDLAALDAVFGYTRAA